MSTSSNEMGKIQATLVGLAIGDALGAPWEFKNPPSNWDGTYWYTGMWGLREGQWTDDTHMALCIVRALLGREDAVIDDIAAEYSNWLESGDLRGAGCTCMSAIRRSRYVDNVYEAGLNTGRYCGNGTLMRCAPLGVMFKDETWRNYWAYADAVITHKHWDAVNSSIALAAIISKLVDGETPLDAIRYARTQVNMKGEIAMVLETVLQVWDCTTDEDLPYLIRDKPYGGTAHATLATALFCFLWHQDSFQEAVSHAVRMGDDTDTRGAVVGALMGAHLGLFAIPTGLLGELEDRDCLAELDAAIYQSRLSEEN